MRNAGSLLLPFAIVVAVLALWPADESDRRAERPKGPTTTIPKAAAPSQRGPPLASAAKAAPRKLTVRLVDGKDQPDAARVLVTDADKKLIKLVPRVLRGASFDMQVSGPVNVVALASKGTLAAVYERVEPRVLDIAFPRGEEIRGKLVDDLGNPIDRRELTVVAEPVEFPWWIRESNQDGVYYEDIGGEPIAFQTKSDEHGRFVLAGLPAGR